MKPDLRRLSGTVIFLATAGLWTAGCSNAFELPDREPAIAGEIVAVGEPSPAPGSSILITVHVKETPTSGDPCGIIFRVTPDTNIGVRPVGGPPYPVGLERLRVGAFLSAWDRGGVAESCPAQAEALAIELEDAGAGP
ncbi:MAG: hypothetical protein OEU54_17490 [Gemmatimonadota bacterium]|nr:hypothetical protein [Gemmatimonadota bacterium]